MKQIIYILTVCCFFCSCNEKVLENNDWNKLGILGKVKSIKQSSFKMTEEYQGYGEYNYEKGKSIKTLNFMFPCKTSIVQFNKLGQIVEINNDDELLQTATYDKDDKFYKETMSIDGQILYSRMYESTNKHNTPNDTLPITKEDLDFMAHLSRIDESGIDLYSSLGNWRTWIPVKRIDKTKMNFCDTIVICSNGDYYFYDSSSYLSGTYNKVEPVDFCYKNKIREKESYVFYENKKLKFIEYLNNKEKYRFNYDDSKGLLTDIKVYGESSYTQNDVIESISFNYNEQNKIDFVSHYDRPFRSHERDILYKVNSIFLKYNSNNQITSFKRFSATREQGSYTDLRENLYQTEFEYEGEYLTQCGSYSINRDNSGRLVSATSQRDTLHFSYHPFEDFSLKNISKYAEPINIGRYTNIETTYDKKGNWTSRICFEGNVPVICYEREIEYY